MYLYQGKLKNKELASVTSPRLPRCSIQSTSLSPHWQFWASLARTAWGHEQHTCHQPGPACDPNTAAPPPPKDTPQLPRGAGGRSPNPAGRRSRNEYDGCHGWKVGLCLLASHIPAPAVCINLFFIGKSQRIVKVFQLREGISSVLLGNPLWKAGEITEIQLTSWHH